jgi:spore coat protein CotH
MMAPRRRLVHRIPTSVRRHWKLLAVLVAFVAVVALAFGEVRIRPYITGDTGVIALGITENITGTVDLFDPHVPHALSIELSDAEYNDMVTQFAADGDKKWVTADVTIDGTAISDVGVRLKGNSTLMKLRGDTFGPAGMPPPPSLGPFAKVSADTPTSLPLLLSFNENADGRGYQGLTELSVRPGAPVLNEAMALSMTAMTGQPTQRYAYVKYTINGESTTRLVLEHPDDTYASTLFDSDGYLYKARAGSRLEYRGADQSDYAHQFKQINAADTGNLQPLINFLQWLHTANDAEFDRSLANWVDVEALARYVATQNLLYNADDMAGPGQNYYLWYDLETQRLSVISWDLNLAMVMGDPHIGPHDPVVMKFPSGFPPPPEASPGGGPSPFEAGNALKERFLKSAAFAGLYEATYWDLYVVLYANGRALELLDEVVETVPVTDGMSAEAIRKDADSLRTWLADRASALENLKGAVAGGG